MTLPDHLAELAVAIETSTTREQAWDAVAIVGKRIAALPRKC